MAGWIDGGREGERIRKLTTQRACHKGSNIKGAEREGGTSTLLVAVRECQSKADVRWGVREADWKGERIRKLTTQRACHRGSNIKGAEWDAHGRIAAGLPTLRINARQSQPQTTPMHAPDHEGTRMHGGITWHDTTPHSGTCAAERGRNMLGPGTTRS